MDPKIIIIISFALVFYTIGVWWEKIAGKLQYKHLVFFILGLFFDTLGTSLMMAYSKGHLISFHSVSGYLAIILMIIHALWASYILIKKDDIMILNFHKYSVLVWLIWLVPYLTPMIINIIK
jgi:uncharacterized repeat protein (TIGR03987 family)